MSKTMPQTLDQYWLTIVFIGFNKRKQQLKLELKGLRSNSRNVLRILKGQMRLVITCYSFKHNSILVDTSIKSVQNYFDECHSINRNFLLLATPILQLCKLFYGLYFESIQFFDQLSVLGRPYVEGQNRL